MKRILTATIALLVIGVILDIGYDPVIWTLVGLFTILGLGELDRLSRKKGLVPFTGLTLVSLLGLFFWQYGILHGLYPKSWAPGGLVIPFLLFAGSTYRWNRTGYSLDDYLRDLSWSVLGLVYLGLAGLSLIRIWELKPPGTDSLGLRLWDRPILGLLFPIFAADTFAYYGGRWLGRRPMAPRLSPKKTWEGLGFGILGAFLAGWLLWSWWYSRWNQVLPPYGWIGIGLLAGCVGPLGDAFESVFKRWAGVKDCSQLFPGHGGILDRLDSLLFTAPFYYLYWVFFILFRERRLGV